MERYVPRLAYLVIGSGPREYAGHSSDEPLAEGELLETQLGRGRVVRVVTREDPDFARHLPSVDAIAYVIDDDDDLAE